MGEWAYYDGGVAIGPDGGYYLNGNRVWTPGDGGGSTSWMPDTSGATSYGGEVKTMGGDSMDGFWGFLGNLGKTYADVWAQTTLQQQNLEGQAYLEGQRMRQQQQQYAMMYGGVPGQPGPIPPLFLLLGAGLLFLMMVKD